MDDNNFKKINDIGSSLAESLRPLYEIGNYLGELVKKSAEWYNEVFKPLQDFGREIQAKLANILQI